MQGVGIVIHHATELPVKEFFMIFFENHLYFCLIKQWDSLTSWVFQRHDHLHDVVVGLQCEVKVVLGSDIGLSCRKKFAPNYNQLKFDFGEF